MSYPIMPVSDLEVIAHLDGEHLILCKKSFNDFFTEGKWYRVKTDDYIFGQKVIRHKPEAHMFEVCGKDTSILIKDNNGRTHRFTDWSQDLKYHHSESLLWSLFEKPLIYTVAQRYPEQYCANVGMLMALEKLAGFSYMGQQLDYLARVAVNDSGVVAGQTGSGKTLMAISIIQMKAPNRALILAPQGTIRGSKTSASQWVSELRRFAVGWPVFELFSSKHLAKIKAANQGILPNGIYVSWFESFLKNGNPTLASQLGGMFELVALDEGHVISHLTSETCQAALKLEATYRWVFTATAASNTIADLFPLIGWTAVPQWHRGDTKNEAWPFTKDDLPTFTDKFLCTERDLTKELVTKTKCELPSPVISSPARLIKLISPHVAFISKSMTNPHYKEPTVIDVRVHLAKQQGELYRYFLDRRHIPCLNPLERARKQSVYLRNICADPMGFTHGGPKVLSNMNPKTLAVLHLALDVVKRGDPIIIICARIGQSDTIHQLLVSIGVSVSRIDSTVPTRMHSHESNLFKTKQTQVHIMGLKSAVSHGYNECPYEIIASIGWSPGELDQAKGRFDRAVSKYDRTLWVVLNKHTIEEVQWQSCTTKEDAVSMIIQGRRVPRNYHEMSLEELMAVAEERFRDDYLVDESEYEKQWQSMKGQFKA